MPGATAGRGRGPLPSLVPSGAESAESAESAGGAWGAVDRVMRPVAVAAMGVDVVGAEVWSVPVMLVIAPVVPGP
ncbi:hypothetical protein [Streptomyces sp. RPA4-5]|uniref:hypothetical protein n=1 Tax=Streptomyces sp. RPA4-5 TaxID=2721245 RepID=UPI002001E099|nr:hypothetical protein [Streptomyces sp. RPA4-5]